MLHVHIPLDCWGSSSSVLVQPLHDCSSKTVETNNSLPRAYLNYTGNKCFTLLVLFIFIFTASFAIITEKCQDRTICHTSPAILRLAPIFAVVSSVLTQFVKYFPCQMARSRPMPGRRFAILMGRFVIHPLLLVTAWCDKSKG